MDVLVHHQRVRMDVIGAGVADTLGLDGIDDDPVWRRRVCLTALEQDLLRCWWVRRLAFIAHAVGEARWRTSSPNVIATGLCGSSAPCRSPTSTPTASVGSRR